MPRRMGLAFKLFEWFLILFSFLCPFLRPSFVFLYPPYLPLFQYPFFSFFLTDDDIFFLF